MKSPCTKVCTLRDEVCVGCGRTLKEIANWSKSDMVKYDAVLSVERSFMREELEKYLEEIKGDQSSLPNQEQTTQLANIQTPPLPNTPQPIVRPVQANVDPNTNLTRTETALLSPEEQVIASRT